MIQLFENKNKFFNPRYISTDSFNEYAYVNDCNGLTPIRYSYTMSPVLNTQPLYSDASMIQYGNDNLIQRTQETCDIIDSIKNETKNNKGTYKMEVSIIDEYLGKEYICFTSIPLDNLAFISMSKFKSFQFNNELVHIITMWVGLFNVIPYDLVVYIFKVLINNGLIFSRPNCVQWQKNIGINKRNAIFTIANI